MPRGSVGRTRVIAQFGVKVDAAAAGLDEVMGKALLEAAAVVGDAARDAVRRDSGGDMRLSGVGEDGARVDVVVQPKGAWMMLVRSAGPLHLLQSPTAGHMIERRAKGRHALRLPGGYRRKVHHPGTRGKRTWSKAVDAAVPKVPGVFQAALRKYLEEQFR
jgi:hypothetical protein